MNIGVTKLLKDLKFPDFRGFLLQIVEVLNLNCFILFTSNYSVKGQKQPVA